MLFRSDKRVAFPQDFFCVLTLSARNDHQVMVNGCTIPYTSIAIDLWKSRKYSKARLLFLSRVDLHQLRGGLSSSWALPIYCSPVTKTILVHWFQASIFQAASHIYSAIDLFKLRIGFRCRSVGRSVGNERVLLINGRL